MKATNLSRERVWFNSSAPFSRYVQQLYCRRRPSSLLAELLGCSALRLLGLASLCNGGAWGGMGRGNGEDGGEEGAR